LVLCLVRRFSGNSADLELARPAFAMGVPAMKEISDWLEKLGMSEYAERFADNKIDVSVLRHLTAERLGRNGVEPSGSDSLPSEDRKVRGRVRRSARDCGVAR
jgi:SAM domain (Sterile alpha motif)